MLNRKRDKKNEDKLKDKFASAAPEHTGQSYEKYDTAQTLFKLRQVSKEIRALGALRNPDKDDKIALEILQGNFCHWMGIFMHREGISMEKAIELVSEKNESHVRDYLVWKNGRVISGIVMEESRSKIAVDKMAGLVKGKSFVEIIHCIGEPDWVQNPKGGQYHCLYKNFIPEPDENGEPIALAVIIKDGRCIGVQRHQVAKEINESPSQRLYQ